LNERSEDPEAIPQGGVSWVYASTVSGTAAGAIFYLYLARALPLGELGAVVVLQAFAFIVATASSFGLNRGFQHFLSYHRARTEGRNLTRPLVGMSYVTTALSGATAAAIAFGLAGLLTSFLFHSTAYLSTVELLSALAGLLSAMMIFAGVLLGLQRYIAYSAVIILGTASLYGAPVVLFLLWHTLQSIVLGWIVGGIAQTVASIVMIERLTRSSGALRSRTSEAPGVTYQGLFAYSLPIVVSVLITTCTYYIDRLILASVANLPTVGIYNYAILFAGASLFVVNPFQTILISRFSALFGRGDSKGIVELVRGSSTLLVLAFVPLALGLAALGPILLRYIVGPNFVPAALPMAVLLGISAAFVPFAILVSIAIGTRRTSATMVSSSCALIANVVLSVVLVPRLGMLGAAIGNSSMFWAPFVVLYLLFRGSGLVRFDTRPILGIWTASIAMAVTIALPLSLLNYSLLLAPVFVTAGVLVFLGLARKLRAVPWEAAEAVAHHLPSWLSPLRPLVFWVAAPSRPPPPHSDGRAPGFGLAGSNPLPAGAVENKTATPPANQGSP